tara:strand:+ start:289 stop:396 length:108 start_codon:yes stop_codon:yes gene_type:complete
MKGKTMNKHFTPDDIRFFKILGAVATAFVIAGVII